VALCGDASKARRVLDWKPKKLFREIVREMIEADCAAVGATLPARNVVTG
jgi:GDP-D-mannose dehydratase